MDTRLEKVDGGFRTVVFYEEYKDGAERRRATKGAKRGRPTGKARSFLLVDRRREVADTPDTLRGVGVLGIGYEPGDGPGALCFARVGWPYLTGPKVRRVGARYVPREWRDRLLEAGWYKIVNGVLYDVIPE